MEIERQAIHELQPLGPVDPEVNVQGAAALPQAGDLRVAPFVRRERRTEKRETQRNRQEGRSRDWGPPRELQPQQLALAIGVLAASAAVAIAVGGLEWTPDRALFVLLAPSLAIRRARRYLLDFLPLAAAILLYAELRGIAHLAAPHPFFLPQIRLERVLFGTPIPPVTLQHTYWHGYAHWYDGVAAVMLQLHFVVPVIVSYLLWLRRRALFYRFSVTLLTLSFAAALTFVVFPAAPPWAAANAGYIDHVVRLPLAHGAAQVHTGVHGALASLIPDNPYAAIPSLHAGYAFLVALFLASLVRSRRLRYLIFSVCALYPLLQSLTILYTGNHYVVDIVLGYGYAAAALWGVNRVWRTRQLPW
jgi:membrane-associated phospholipid phosphatase